MNATFLHAVNDFSGYFKNAPVIGLDDELIDCPVTLFTGTISDCHQVWPALQKKVTRVHWQKAAILGSLPRAQGRRGGEPTPMQTFARAHGIGTAYASRMAKAHSTVVAALRDPGINRSDMPRVVEQAHARQRSTLEQCVIETQQHYGCTPGVALRLIDLQVAAFESGSYTKALAARGLVQVAADAGGTTGEPPKPWTLALAKRAAAEGR